MPPALPEPECIVGKWEVVVDTLKHLASGYLFVLFYELFICLACVSSSVMWYRGNA